MASYGYGEGSCEGEAHKKIKSRESSQWRSQKYFSFRSPILIDFIGLNYQAEKFGLSWPETLSAGVNGKAENYVMSTQQQLEDKTESEESDDKLAVESNWIGITGE